MRIKQLLIVALMTLVAGFANAQDMTIPVDKDVRIGKLDNGLTYYIRYNNWPEHRANFYIAQKVGSLQEEESQRGLAHFLEHMCFNGSDNFKGNDVIRYCESIGVQFGGDLNAYTSIDETVYNIDNVPTKRQSSLDSCLLILRDWACGLTLDPTEIDQERGVIHEEWRLRTSAMSRMLERNLPKLYPGSKYGLRYPIGLMSVIDNFKPKELRDYYEKWYHPANQGIIVIGDVDVDHVEAKIKELFGGNKNPENAAPVVSEPVPDTEEPIIIVDQDKEQTNSILMVMYKHDPFPDSMKDNLQYLLYKYMVNAAAHMLNQRYTEETQKAECPFAAADASDGQYIYAKTKDAFTLTATPKDVSRVEEALKTLVLEARRAAEFGFTATEYDRYKENYLSTLEKQYSNKDKRTNTQFFNQCKGNFLTNEPMPSIDYTYQMMKLIVPQITVDNINEVIKQLVPEDDANLVVLNFNNEKEGNVYPTTEGMLAALNAARTAEITAFVDNVKDEPLITKMPKAGKIKKEVKGDKFDYTELTLSNGVKVILKKTDFKKDEVRISGYADGGGSLYGQKDFTNIQLFDDVIGASGLGNFSSTELSKALAGKIANANLSMDNRGTNISGNATPKDVETMLQMVYLYFTAINKDEKAFGNVMSQYEITLKNRDLTPETAFSDSLIGTLYGHNPRVTPLTLDKLSEVSYDRILQMAKERTANASAWTFTIIGNYDEATIRDLVCQYLGALPGKGKADKSQRVLKMQDGVIDNIFTRKMETPKSIAVMYWHSDDMPYSVENSIRADMAGQILSMVYLKKIREEASAAYSCGAQGVMSLEEDNTSTMLVAQCPMKPEKKDIALDIMRAEVPALAEACDAEMLQRVKEYMLKSADQRFKTNSYWNGVIKTYRKFGIDRYTDYKSLIEAQTPETIMAFMKEFLKANNRITVVMLPEE